MIWWDDPIVYLFILALVAWRLRSRRLAIGVAAFFVVVSFTPLSMWLVAGLEGEPPSGEPIGPTTGMAEKVSSPVKREAIVILTGGTLNYYPLLDRYSWDWGVDRATEGIRLFKKGAAPLLIVTGTEKVRDGEEREVDSIARLAREGGVPADAIVLEREARNTAENAENTAKILREKGIRDFYLVTSAFHMPRSMGCFEKLGFSPTPYPVDYTGIPEGWRAWTATPGRRWFFMAVFLHEAIGMATYKLRGKI